jgi:hypothetical protein
VRKKEITLASMRQFQYDVARGKYVAAENIQPTWSQIVLAGRNAVLAVPGKARMLLGLTNEQTIASKAIKGSADAGRCNSNPARTQGLKQ